MYDSLSYFLEEKCECVSVVENCSNVQDLRNWKILKIFTILFLDEMMLYVAHFFCVCEEK